MRNKLKKINKIEKLFLAASILLSAALFPYTAWAAGADQVIGGLNSIKSMLLSIVGIAGIIATIFSAIKLYTAFTSHETTQIPGAIMQLAGSLILAFISGFLALFGLS